MSRKFYDFTLEVLEKVSFDAQLFLKEVTKAKNRLLPHELFELKIWLEHFLFLNPKLSNKVVVKQLMA